MAPRTSSSTSTAAQPSNIRASVHWRSPDVYAGEELECIITFTNTGLAEAPPGSLTTVPNIGVGGGAAEVASVTHRREGSVSTTAAPSQAASHSRRSSVAQQSQFPPQHQRRLSRTVSLSGQGGYGNGQSGRAAGPMAGGVPTSVSPVIGPAGRVGSNHRPTLSLNVVAGSSATGRARGPNSAKTPNTAHSARGHGRSLSIISLGSEPLTPMSTGGGLANAGKRAHQGAKHGRSTSLQVVPNSLRGTPNLSMTSPSPRVSSPLVEGRVGSATTPPPLSALGGGAAVGGEETALPVRPARRRPGTQSADTTPQLGAGLARQSSLRKGRVSPGHSATPSWTTLPPQQQLEASSATNATPSTTTSQHSDLRPKPTRMSSMHSGQQRSISPRPPDGWTSTGAHTSNPLNPISRVMSESSVAGTPRTSSEIYSNSNHSDETLASEAPSQYAQNGRLMGVGPKHWPYYNQPQRSPSARPAQPETLMMGYVQTMGSFVLDGSLVNSAPFEEVKRKGVQGGGGVVGVERSSSSSSRLSGMFGAFGWSNIGESLGGLLGSDDNSSIAQMKALAGSKSIPLLSTPQNLLFVDLRLAPGESASFSYCFPLPRGLPPSHRGRAIKVEYHLSLGVQRPEGQAVRHVEVPFRVLGSYNSRGELLGHDLMSPYVLLRDAAMSKRVETISAFSNPDELFRSSSNQQKSSESRRSQSKNGLEDFLRYTERLLEPRKESNGALVSPTALTSPKENIMEAPPSTTKEAIDLAIMRANYASPSNNDSTATSPVTSTNNSKSSQLSSGNRFNIARNGQPIAVLTLQRPTYRLGEAVTGMLDFTAPLLQTPQSPSGTSSYSPTYSVTLDLESTERIDPALALRSTSSIHRVTRKSHSSARENVLFARRVAFSLPIPLSASPSFDTTGVSLVWRLRVEFVTARQSPQQQSGSKLSQQQGQDVGLGVDGGAAAAAAASSRTDSGQTDGTATAEGPEATPRDGDGLLEVLGKDDRNTVLIAKERLLAESFEVAIPLKVLGVPGAGTEGEGNVRSTQGAGLVV